MRTHFLWNAGDSSGSSFPVYNHPSSDSLKMTRIKHWTVGRQNPLFLLQNLLIASKLTNNSVSGCCCTLLARINVLRHLDVSSNEPKPLLKFLNRLSPFLRLRVKLLGSFKGALLPNLNKMVERKLLITGVRQHENIFQISRTNLRTWLSTLRLGSNNVQGRNNVCWGVTDIENRHHLTVKIYLIIVTVNDIKVR